MTVYVDDMEAPFRGLVMCHMIADSTEELLRMVDKIGVDRKWIQKAGTPGEHFDIAKSKRKLAVQAGAVEITMHELGSMTLERRRAHNSTSEQAMAPGKQLTKYDEAMAALAEEYASGEHAGGDFLSTKGGILTFDSEPLPGNQMLAVILDVVQERTFYADKYDPTAEHNKPPVCYAFGRAADEDEMGPHPSMQTDLSYFQPQNDICKTCPNNEWGSADTGRGKACAERRRLAILPAGYYAPKKGTRDFEAEIFTDPEHYQTADIAYLKLNVMSVKDWGRYVAQLNSQYRRPPFGVISRVYLEPDAKSQFRVKFEMIEQFPEEMFPTLFERYEEAKAGIIFGYPPPSEEAKAQGAKGKIRR